MPAFLEKFIHVIPNDTLEFKDVYTSMKRTLSNQNRMSVCTGSSFDPSIMNDKSIGVIFWKKIHESVRLRKNAHVSLVLTDDINIGSGDPDSIRNSIEFMSMAEHADMVISSDRALTMMPYRYRTKARMCIPIHFYDPQSMGTPGKREKLFSVLTVGRIRGSIARQIHDAIASSFKKKHVHLDHSWDPRFKSIADQSKIVFPIPNYSPEGIVSMEFGIVERCAATSAMLVAEANMNDENVNFADVFKINIQMGSIGKSFNPEMLIANLSSVLDASISNSYWTSLTSKLSKSVHMTRAWSNAMDEIRANDQRREGESRMAKVSISPLQMLETHVVTDAMDEGADSDDGDDGSNYGDDDGGEDGDGNG